MLILFLWMAIFINTKGPWLNFLHFVSCPASLLHELSLSQGMYVTSNIDYSL